MGSLSAAFVLTGGRSTRMGRDKALIFWAEHGQQGSEVLAQRVARIAAAVAGSAMLVGDPQRHRHLGFPVITDLHPGFGPLSGVEAALARTHAEWNLVVACDLPNLTPEFLTGLFARNANAVAQTDYGPAVCAVLHRDCLREAQDGIAQGKLSWRRFVERVGAEPVLAQPPEVLANMNTPKDLTAHG